MIKIIRIKSYSSIWSVEGVLYAVGDVKLPFPFTFSQVGWFVGSLVTVFFLSDVPPVSLIENSLIKYVGIPVLIAWFMSQKSFDGKSPIVYLVSLISYFFRPKLTYGGKKIYKKRKYKLNDEITAVRSDVSELAD